MAFIYILFFVISIRLWLINKRAASFLCFILFLENGLFIIPKEIEGIKLTHLAFGYIVVLFILNYKQILNCAKIHSSLSYKLLLLIVFFFSSILFSIFYYGFPPTLSIVTGLRYVVFSSFFIFFLGNYSDYSKLTKWIFYITFVTSILYIGQCLFGIQLLAYGIEQSGEAMGNGLYRWYNLPPFAEFFMYISFFVPKMIPKQLRFFSYIIFPLALFFSNGRSIIIIAGLNIIIISSMIGNFKQILRLGVGLGLIFVLVSDVVLDRMEQGGKTRDDIELVFSGNFEQADYQSKNGLTLLYRLAWIKERWDYLANRPLIEQMYGLGMITDESDVAKKKYNFSYGLINPNDGYVVQIRTPDLAWGNFLTCYGLLGTILFFIFYFSFLGRLMLYKKDNLAKILIAYMITLLLTSFAGSTISEPYMVAMLFFWFAIIVKRQQTLNVSKV